MHTQSSIVHRRSRKGMAAALCAPALLAGFLTSYAPLAADPEVKHIIVMVADGWGYNQVEAASFFRYGKPEGQIYHRFPVRYATATYDYNRAGSYEPDRAWESFEYFTQGPTDSASSATALSTGVRTVSGRIGLGPDGEPLIHAQERARDSGRATGVVTSVQLSHATPASFSAHNESRNNYAEIARQMLLESGLDLIMGAGNPDFNRNGEPTDDKDYQYVGGEELWNELLEGDVVGENHDTPWTVVQSREEFMALQSGPTPERLLGVPEVRATLQHDRSGDVDAEPFREPLIEGVPTLVEMTRGALNFLGEKPDGFFLHIEGGAVDWAGHRNRSGRMIEEMIDFDYTVEAIVEWVEHNSNWDETLLIVTGDHETGYLTGPGSGPDSDPMWQPIENRGMWRQPGMEWHSGGHTNQLIPLFARGAAASGFAEYVEDTDPVHGEYIHLTAVGRLVAELLGADPDDR